MPYKSQQQRKYFNANVGKKPGLTHTVVNEYNQASKGMSLPKKAKKSRKKRRPMSSKMGGYIQ